MNPGSSSGDDENEGCYRSKPAAGAPCSSVPKERGPKPPFPFNYPNRQLNDGAGGTGGGGASLSSSCRSEEHTSELQSPMRISSAVFCLQQTKIRQMTSTHT